MHCIKLRLPDCKSYQDERIELLESMYAVFGILAYVFLDSSFHTILLGSEYHVNLVNTATDFILWIYHNLV